jgi:hypothetical protein
MQGGTRRRTERKKEGRKESGRKKEARKGNERHDGRNEDEWGEGVKQVESVTDAWKE